MRIDDIKTCICNWISDDKEVSVCMPANASAHDGRYFAVDVIHVSQYGTTTTPPPSDDGSNKSVAQYVATVVVHEVAGSGDKLRKFRNDFCSEAFCEYVRSRFNDNDGLDKAFSVWDVSDIAWQNLVDGRFYIQQQFFSFRVQFNDFVGYNRGSVESVSGKLGTMGFETVRS